MYISMRCVCVSVCMCVCDCIKYDTQHGERLSKMGGARCEQ